MYDKQEKNSDFTEGVFLTKHPLSISMYIFRI